MKRLLSTIFVVSIFSSVLFILPQSAQAVSRVSLPCNFWHTTLSRIPYINEINSGRGHVQDAYGSWRHAVDIMANGNAALVYDDSPLQNTSSPAMSCGTDTVAFAGISGTVEIGYNSGDGNWIKINRYDGVSMVYSHMDSISVQNGSYVSSGVKIGEIGSTGNASGKHIHLFIRKNGINQSYNSNFSTLTNQWEFMAPKDSLLFAGQYDSDTKDDFVKYDPATSTWYISESSRVDGFTNPRVVTFGWAGVIPLTGGNYDNDNKTDIGIYDPRTSTFYIALSNTPNSLINPYQLTYGWAGTVPIMGGDYDGDFKTDIGVIDPKTSTWYINRSKDGQLTVPFAWAGTNPIMGGDYDDDDKTDIAVVDPTTSTWYIAKSNSLNPYTNPYSITFGWKGAMPIPAGDYDGDTVTDLAVLDTNTMTYYITLSDTNTGYNPTFAWNGTIPLIGGNFDGDNSTDLAVFDPASGVWYVRGTTAGNYNISFGGIDLVNF